MCLRLHHKGITNLLINSQAALDRLLAGNQRYAAMRQIHPRQTSVERQHLVEGQHPFAAVLSCSDSRVPSELIFDQGLGDLFIVRTAGHVLDDLVLASLEYAVYVLGVPLLMVLGHAQCGAVSAALKPDLLPGHMPKLVTALRVTIGPVEVNAVDALDQAIRANSRDTAKQMIVQSDVLRETFQQGHTRIVAAHYELSTGYVTVLDPL